MSILKMKSKRPIEKRPLKKSYSAGSCVHSQTDPMDEPLICPLCLYFEPEVFGDYFVVAKCGHLFHHECIMKILARKIYQCPLSCKFPIEPDSLQRVYGVGPSSLPSSRRASDVDLTSVFSNPNGIPDVEHTFKVALLGDPGVGKSCIIRRFADNFYNENVSITPGVDLVRKLVNIGGTVSQLIVWDTAGQETFRSIIPACVRGVQGIMFVYDVTNMDTFEAISHWMEFANKNAPQNCVKVLVGNKSDQESSRIVDYRCGKVMADVMKCPFFETSAKESSNVESVFRAITAKILEEEWMQPSDNAWQQNSICLHDYQDHFDFTDSKTNIRIGSGSRRQSDGGRHHEGCFGSRNKHCQI